jgi:anti-sigma factor RsiW
MSEPDDLSVLIKQRATRYTAPSMLRNRVKAMVSQTDPGPEKKHRPAPARPIQVWRRWANMAGAFSFGMVASMVLLLFMRGNVDEERMAQAVIDSHVRSLMGDHLVDVPSSDKHTVKPWFAGKLDYAPPVKDLSSAGASLVGGRLDYVGQKPIAALVYRLNRHAINVFIWPSEVSDHGPAYSVHHGFNVVQWIADGMQCWMVSDLNVEELGVVARLFASADKQHQ